MGREEDLAERFGVSRPTVREALRLLGSSHLIRISKGPGGGIFVDATPEQSVGRMLTAALADLVSHQMLELEAMLETWMLFEPPLARIAAQRARPADRRRLRTLLEEQEVDPANAALVASIGHRLHEQIGQIAGNPLSAILLEWVAVVLLPAVESGTKESVAAALADHHRAIVTALVEGDGAAAEAAVRRQIEFSNTLI